MAPIAAKQGAQRRLKHKNERPETLVKASPILINALPPAPNRIPSVPTIFSFATSPVIAATVLCQLPPKRIEYPGNKGTKGSENGAVQLFACQHTETFFCEAEERSKPNNDS